MKFRKWISISLGAALLMSILNGCGASQTTPNHDSAADKGGIRSAAPASPSGSNAASLRTPAALDLTGATIITLSGSTVSIEGSGAEAEGGVVTITEGGIYAVSGTLDDGRIIGMGTHRELMESCEAYQEIYYSQRDKEVSA